MTTHLKRLIFKALLIFKRRLKIQGTVFKIESKDYYLLNESEEEIRCSLRGKFQQEFSLKRGKLFSVDIVAVGDQVFFEMNRDGTGVIEKVMPRRNYISRKVPKIKGASTRGERLEQIVAANVDNLVVVSSCQLPKLNNRLIDRLIVAGESSHTKPIIVINKTDLDPSQKFKSLSELYRNIGYAVFETSTITKNGLLELCTAMKNKINLMWGHSGVGKSSLLNEMYKGLNFRIGKISDFNSKGKHTTVTSILRKVDADTFIIDTPGIREIDPYGVRKEDLGHYFIDFKNFQDNCRFNTCTHQHEPGCAIIEAVNNGLLNGMRYQSYLNMLVTIEDGMNF